MLDYLITEAVYLRVAKQDEQFREEAEEKAKREEWKKEQVHELEKFRGGLPGV